MHIDMNNRGHNLRYTSQWILRSHQIDSYEWMQDEGGGMLDDGVGDEVSYGWARADFHII